MSFDDADRQAVLEHMNKDHRHHSIAIAVAHGAPADSVDAEVVDLDEAAATLRTFGADGSTVTVEVPWPIAVSDRSDLRTAFVALTEAALETS